MRKIKSAHIKKNIIKIIIPVLIKIKIVLKLEFFIKNNVGNNDICWRVIYNKLRFDIKILDNKRVKCLNHILNFAAKTFFFKKNTDAFENDINQKRNNVYIKKFREF
jgi:hypothetical protein